MSPGRSFPALAAYRAVSKHQPSNALDPISPYEYHVKADLGAALESNPIAL